MKTVRIFDRKTAERVSSTPISPYTELANAIIVRAADDYRFSYLKLKMDNALENLQEKDNFHARRLKETTRFFESDIPFLLTGVSGSYILNKLTDELEGYSSSSDISRYIRLNKKRLC